MTVLTLFFLNANYVYLKFVTFQTLLHPLFNTDKAMNKQIFVMTKRCSRKILCSKLLGQQLCLTGKRSMNIK